MAVTIVTVVMATALAATLVSATVRPTVSTAQVSTDVPSALNRTSRELRVEPVAENSTSDSPEHRMAGRKLSADDDYRTLSSMTSDVVVEASATATGPKVYPSLTTGAPAGFVTRGRYIRNPFGNFGKDDQEMEFDDDQHADFMFTGGGGGGMPKWNRYNTNHRQLNKFMTTPIEADITVDEDGSAGYGSAFDFGGGGGGMGYDAGNYRNPGGGMGYDSGNYRNPGMGWADGGGGMMGWYNEPIAQASRPLPIIAEIRHPSSSGSSSSSNKMSIDMTKIGMLALMKIAIAKLKALGFIKAMLLVMFKVKLLILLVAMKFLMIAKFTKLTMILPALMSFFTIPMLFSRLSRLHSLINQPVLVPNNFGSGSSSNVPATMTGSVTPSTSEESTETDSESRRRMSRTESPEPLVPRMTNIGQIIRSEKCLERVSCRMAGAKKPSLALIWLNWIASPLSTYIPSKKLKTFVSTFTEVTNYRLDNLYSNLLPNDWTKWCNDHYTCNETTKKS
ncbi:Hypothetical protein CINCED_3A017209 [Cinara cedri]|uniref:Uncharacterized protein n=1 Tax=Cinara cedri TaxID=506608 RepID=A0A5E4MR52_9HEMI|nr:Hypothetical protein CINCED_3A017209 [Cinara cedri]